MYEKFKSLGTLAIAIFVSGTVFAQVGALKPIVWLDAKDFEQSSNQWSDKSGSNTSIEVAQGNQLSTSGLINFNPTVDFNSVNDSLSFEMDLSKSTNLTTIVVHQIVDEESPKERGLWQADLGETGQLYLTTTRSRGLLGVTKYTKGHISIPTINSTSHGWGKKPDNNQITKIKLGASEIPGTSLGNYRGSIAEVLVYDHLLSELESEMVQSYLSLKYGTTQMYSNYIDSKQKVIWDYSEDSLYSFSIAGIGKDQSIGLNQKQSWCTSEKKFLVIGAGGIAETNEANEYQLQAGNYLIWGGSEGAMALEPDNEEEYLPKLPLMDRKWKMKAVGNKANDIETKLEVHVSELLEDPKECYLVLDRAGTGDFSGSNIEYISAERIDEYGVAHFSDFKWDTDGSGFDLFTFSFGMNSGLDLVHPSCFNEATGTIKMKARGGKAPYTFELKSDDINYSEEWTSENRQQEVDALIAGNYTLTVRAANGDFVTNDFELQNPTQLQVPLESSYELDEQGNIALDGSLEGHGELNYLWTNEFGYNAETPIVDLTETGIYNLKITNDKGCEIEKSIQIFPSSMLYDFRLFPNPSSGNYTLELRLNQKEDVTISVYNAIGDLVDEDRGNAMYFYRFNKRIYESGMYSIKIQAGTYTETLKLVVNQ